MTLPPASFDGVFANAVLFHVPSLALPGVLDQLHAALKPGGALLASNPRGQDEEGFVDGRYPASTASRPGANWSAAAALPWWTTIPSTRQAPPRAAVARNALAQGSSARSAQPSVKVRRAVRTCVRRV
jgi:hypothetical protein